MPTGWNYINAATSDAYHLSDFPDTTTLLYFSRPGGGEWASGPIVLPCFAEPLEAECDGCGTQKTMSGPKSTVLTAVGGCMWIVVKRHGTLHCFTLKVRLSISAHSSLFTNIYLQAGARSSHIALRSLPMGARTSLDDMSAIPLSMPRNATSAQKAC